MFMLIVEIQMLFVVGQTVVDDLGKVLGHFSSGVEVCRAIKTFVFFGSDGSLGDNHKFADFSVTKLITIAVTVIPEKMIRIKKLQ